MRTELPEIKSPITGAKVVSMNTDPTLYHKQPHDRGHKQFVMSSGQLRNFMACPSRWMAGFEDDESGSMKWGTLIDCLLTSMDSLHLRVAVQPETYVNDDGQQKPWHNGAKVCKSWQREHSDKLVVTNDVMHAAKTAVKRLCQSKYVLAVTDFSAAQVWLAGEYNDEDTGITVPLKGLIDIVPDENGPFGKSLVDLKTAKDASPRDWVKTVFYRGYHIQAALYLDLYCAAVDEDRVEFRHIVQENFEPYEVGRRLLTSDYIDMGRAAYLGALKRYCRCLSTGVWDGYDDAEGLQRYQGWTFTAPEAWMVGL